MAKIAYILLCHKDPDAIIERAQSLIAGGDCMSIHFDARANADDYAKITDALKGQANVVFAKRVKCGWGEWSLVQATLNALRAAEEAFQDATHFYMISGDCYPIKSAQYVHDFLDENEIDYVECSDFFKSDWIKVGLKKERLVYWHFFNERQNKRMFYASMNIQEKLGIRQKIPSDLQVMIGSQWWVLRRRTVEAVLDFIKSRKDVVKFFKYTWIPDETFFQTLVHHLIPKDEILSQPLTFLMFSDYGMPVTFHNDHYDLLLSQNYLFARKISPFATELTARLMALYSSDQNTFEISAEGRSLYHFLSTNGRVGRRHGGRIWEKAASVGRSRELLVIVCKKWHMAKRLTGPVRNKLHLRAVDYVFDENMDDLPDMGGIESSVYKRSMHRRACLNLLYDHFDTDRLIICLDPSRVDVMDDLNSDDCKTKFLHMSCSFDDSYLRGHAERAGLIGSNASDAVLQTLLPAVRHNFEYENEQIIDRGFAHMNRISDTESEEANSHELAHFFGTSYKKALSLARTPYLFSD